MKIKILDHAVVSYAFQLNNLKNDNSQKEEPNEGKIIIGISIPDDPIKNGNIGLMVDLEISSLDYKLELKMAFHIEKGKLTIKYLKEKERELLALLYPYIILTSKNLLSLADIPISGFPYLPNLEEI